jgi:hypothetical protein
MGAIVSPFPGRDFRHIAADREAAQTAFGPASARAAGSRCFAATFNKKPRTMPGLEFVGKLEKSDQ